MFLPLAGKATAWPDVWEGFLVAFFIVVGPVKKKG